MIDYDEETPELQPTDCTGDEDCPASWHVHGCYEDGGGCTDPHEHVIAAGPSVHDRLRQQLAASLPQATPAQLDNLMETARQLGQAIAGVQQGADSTFADRMAQRSLDAKKAKHQ